MLLTRHVRQPGIIYGFYESPQDELQAYATARVNETPGLEIHRKSQDETGTKRSSEATCKAVAKRDPKASNGQLILSEVTVFRPQTPLGVLGQRGQLSTTTSERLVHLLTMMAMRFLTAHEMTHILNGHLRYRLGVGTPGTIAEARLMLLPKDALVSQTLEMDADSGAVVIASHS
ncbi:MAG: hypothetical protein DMG56_13535 [Acidobacteria bacterium]|nr:MAG: hypothetical protein DMG56_13535 [Acidobacteriota bacterium]